jgi:hypothetical protein
MIEVVEEAEVKEEGLLLATNVVMKVTLLEIVIKNLAEMGASHIKDKEEMTEVPILENRITTRMKMQTGEVVMLKEILVGMLLPTTTIMVVVGTKMQTWEKQISNGVLGLIKTIKMEEDGMPLLSKMMMVGNEELV